MAERAAFLPATYPNLAVWGVAFRVRGVECGACAGSRIQGRWLTIVVDHQPQMVDGQT